MRLVIARRSLAPIISTAAHAAPVPPSRGPGYDSQPVNKAPEKMSQSDALVSIGLPTLNGERWLSEALDTLLAQTHANFEIVISDNGSTDRTGEIAQDYAARDPRIRYLCNQYNLAQYDNFNQSFRLTRGPYFMWAGDHDRWEPTFIEKLLAVLEDDPEVALAYPLTGHIDADGKLLETYDSALSTKGLDAPERFWKVYAELTRCDMIFGLYRTEQLLKTRLIPRTIGGDRLMLSELALHGDIERFEECLMYLRHNRPEEDAYQAEKRRIAALYPDDRDKWDMLTPHLVMMNGFLELILYAKVPKERKEALLRHVSENAQRKFPFLQEDIQQLMSVCNSVLEKDPPRSYYIAMDTVEMIRSVTRALMFFPELKGARELRATLLERLAK
jgi:glycosyltransferase involved in cell wall biosynthesis